MITIPTTLAVYLIIANLLTVILSILAWNKVTNKKELGLIRFFARRRENVPVSQWNPIQSDKDPIEVWEKDLEYIEDLRGQIANRVTCQRAKLYIEKLQIIDEALQQNSLLAEEEKKALERLRNDYFSILKKEILQTKKQEELKKARDRLGAFIEERKKQREG